MAELFFINFIIIIFGLINDFLGNKIFKFLLAIVGFLIGFTIGIFLALLAYEQFRIDELLLWFIVLFSSVAGVVISFALFRVALFIQCFFIGFFITSIIGASLQSINLLYNLDSLNGVKELFMGTIIISTIVGLLFGVLSIILYKYIIIIWTCLNGFLLVNIGLFGIFLFALEGMQFLILPLVSLVLSILGGIVQLKTFNNLNPLHAYATNNTPMGNQGYHMNNTNQPRPQFESGNNFNRFKRSVDMKKNNSKEDIRSYNNIRKESQDSLQFPKYEESKQSVYSGGLDNKNIENSYEAQSNTGKTNQEVYGDQYEKGKVFSEQNNIDNLETKTEGKEFSENKKDTINNQGFPKYNQAENVEQRQRSQFQPSNTDPRFSNQNMSQEYPNQAYVQGNMGAPNNQGYSQGQEYKTATIKFNDRKLFIEPEKIQNSFFGMNPVIRSIAKFMYLIFLVYMSLSVTFLFNEYLSVFEYFSFTEIIGLGLIVLLWGLKEYYPSLILSIIMIISKIRIIKMFIDGNYNYISVDKQAYILFILTVITIVALALFVFYIFQTITRTGEKPRILKIFKG